MDALVNFLISHSKIIFTGLAVLYLAFSSTIPETIPKTTQDWWTWGREFLHSIAPIKMTRTLPIVQVPVSTVQVPVSTVEQKLTPVDQSNSSGEKA